MTQTLKAQATEQTAHIERTARLRDRIARKDRAAGRADENGFWVPKVGDPAFPGGRMTGESTAALG